MGWQRQLNFKTPGMNSAVPQSVLSYAFKSHNPLRLIEGDFPLSPREMLCHDSACARTRFHLAGSHIPPPAWKCGYVQSTSVPMLIEPAAELFGCEFHSIFSASYWVNLHRKFRPSLLSTKVSRGNFRGKMVHSKVPKLDRAFGNQRCHFGDAMGWWMINSIATFSESKSLWDKGWTRKLFHSGKASAWVLWVSDNLCLVLPAKPFWGPPASHQLICHPFKIRHISVREVWCSSVKGFWLLVGTFSEGLSFLQARKPLSRIAATFKSPSNIVLLCKKCLKMTQICPSVPFVIVRHWAAFQRH